MASQIGVSMSKPKQKRMSKKQALRTAAKLKIQAANLAKNGHKQLADQTKLIIDRLNRKVKNGKYL